jgi:hypothetical protein
MQLYYFYRHNSENTIFISRRTAEHHLEFLWVDSLRQDLVNHNEEWQKNIYAAYWCGA